MHFPPPSSKRFDWPAFGWDQGGDFGLRREDELKHIKHIQTNNVLSRESAAMLYKKRRASPAEEDTPGKRTKCNRGVMAPAISEVGHNQPQVSRVQISDANSDPRTSLGKTMLEKLT